MGLFPLSEEWADGFARDWIAAWNSHDLDRICSHYAADIEFTSPFVMNLAENPDGTILSVPALRKYFGRALERFPDLQFEHMFTCAGIRTVTVVYRSINRLVAAETMELCSEGKVMRAFAHYSRTPHSV